MQRFSCSCKTSPKNRSLVTQFDHFMTRQGFKFVSHLAHLYLPACRFSAQPSGPEPQTRIPMSGIKSSPSQRGRRPQPSGVPW